VCIDTLCKVWKHVTVLRFTFASELALVAIRTRKSRNPTVLQFDLIRWHSLYFQFDHQQHFQPWPNHLIY